MRTGPGESTSNGSAATLAAILLTNSAIATSEAPSGRTRATAHRRRSHPAWTKPGVMTERNDGGDPHRRR
jgi:hypothetical protein